MRPPLRYPGSKAQIAPWIVSHFSEHSHYVEPFAGSGAVLFAKPPVVRETLNDLDGRIVNLYRVLKTPALLERLVETIGATAYAESELVRAYEYAGDEPVTLAWATIVVSHLAIGPELVWKPHFRVLNSSSSNDRLPERWSRVPALLEAAAERLRTTQITCRDALKVIEANSTPEKKESKETLIYCDPPYLLSTRKQTYYREEMKDDAAHEKLLKVLLRHPGPVVLSGYESALYTDTLEPRGWRVSRRRTWTQSRGERDEVRGRTRSRGRVAPRARSASWYRSSRSRFRERKEHPCEQRERGGGLTWGPCFRSWSTVTDAAIASLRLEAYTALTFTGSTLCRTAGGGRSISERGVPEQAV